MTPAERRDVAIAFATLAVIAAIAMLGLGWGLLRGAAREVWCGVWELVTKGGST